MDQEIKINKLSESVLDSTGILDGSLRMVGNHSKSAKAEGA